MKITPKFGNKIITLPSAQVILNLKEADEKQLKVLIYSLAEQNASADEIADACGVTKDEVKDALLYWKEKGAISVVGLKGSGKVSAAMASPVVLPGEEEREEERARRVYMSDRLPRYTEDEVERKLRRNPELKGLIDECCRILGDILNSTEAGDIVVMYDYLHLGKDYIMLLCSHCAASGHTSLQYIKTVAVRLFNDGITEYSDLEAYYDRREAAVGLESKIKRLFGFGSREFTSSERECIDEWIKWKIPENIIDLAFDATAAGASKPGVAYMHSVIKNWYAEGLDTPEKIEKNREEYKKKTAYTNKKGPKNGDISYFGGSFDTEDFFEAALKRSYGGKKEDKKN